MAGGHAYGPRGRPCGAPRGGRGGWHVEGPRVSGPWLDFWGGNAICVNRPLIYRSGNFFFFFFLKVKSQSQSVDFDHRILFLDHQSEQ